MWKNVSLGFGGWWAASIQFAETHEWDAKKIVAPLATAGESHADFNGQMQSDARAYASHQ